MKRISLCRSQNRLLGSLMHLNVRSSCGIRPFSVNRVVGDNTQNRSNSATDATDTISNLTQKRQKCTQNSIQRLGCFSDAARRLYTKILSGEVDAASELRRVLVDPHCNLETIRVCFYAEYSRLQERPRNERPSMIRKGDQGIACMTLDSLWTDNKLWAELTFYGGSFSFHLCYFAIAEGLEHLLIEWLRVDVDLTTVVDGADDLARMWRNSLFLNIIIALMDQDIANKADAALRCFFKVLKMRHQAHGELSHTAHQQKDTSFARLSFDGVTLRLVREFGSGQYTKTNVRLYENFMQFHRRFKHLAKEPFHAYNMATLQLYHPQRPQPDAVLEFLRPYFNDSDLVRSTELDSAVPVTRKMLEDHLRHTVRLLYKQGRLRDVAWLNMVLSSIVNIKPFAQHGRSAEDPHKELIPVELQLGSEMQNG